MSNESNEVCDWLAKCWKPVAEARHGVIAKSDSPVGDRSIPGDVKMRLKCGKSRILAFGSC
jgi:hypothetical protein